MELRGSHSCAQNAQEWGSLCGVRCRRKSSSSGECLAAALHGEGNAGSFDCALLRFAHSASLRMTELGIDLDDRLGEKKVLPLRRAQGQDDKFALEGVNPSGTAFVVSHLCATNAQRWGTLGGLAVGEMIRRRNGLRLRERSCCCGGRGRRGRGGWRWTGLRLRRNRPVRRNRRNVC